MESSSEFVQEKAEERREDRICPGGATGWESIVFELEDDYGSDFLTAGTVRQGPFADGLA